MACWLRSTALPERSVARVRFATACVRCSSNLGISGQAVTPDLADTYNLPAKHGVIVESVTHDSGADKAGLKGGRRQVVVAGETYVLGGDIIVTFDGRKISSIEELRDAVAAHRPGDKLKVVIYRGANKSSVTVTRGRQPQSPQG